jgi:arylsulfatase A-like enzyme
MGPMRSAFIALIVCAQFAWAAAPAVTQDVPAYRPNVLLIVSDDQGFHDLGCYGNASIRTPHLDRLAREGVRLTGFYVTSPACTTSRASLLTGRYPQRNGTTELFRNDAVDLGYQYDAISYASSPERVLGTDVREVFLSQVLAQAGYRCGVFGKWDLGQLRRFLPLQRGFHDFYGFVNTGIDYWTHERYGVASMYRNNQPTVEDKGRYSTDLFAREAERFVREDDGRPWFMYLAFNAPHSAANLDRSRRTVQAPDEYLEQYPPAGDAKGRARRAHMAAITCMDAAIGRLLDLLEKQGRTDKTLVIFLSDNGGSGPGDNHPLRGGKGTLFEGGHRVPCIVRWPGRIPAGGESDAFLTSLELFPTVLAAVQVPAPHNVVLDGFDMMGVLRAEAATRREEMFWQFRGDVAARVGQYKWVQSRKGGGLFDLSADVGEGKDLSKDRPDVLARVKARFTAWTEEMLRAEPRGPFRDY